MHDRASDLRPVRRLFAAGAVAAALSAAGAGMAGGAQAGGDSESTAVRITVHRGEITNSSRADVRAVEMVVLDRGGPTSVRTGWKVPFVIREADAGGGVQYQDVGLSVILRADVLDDGRIRVRGSMEDSTIDDRAALGSSARTPTLRTFEQQFNAVVGEGEPVEIGSVALAGGGSVFVEIEAEILD